MKESVSEKEVEENDEQVQDFAEDEPAEIYVVPGCWRQKNNKGTLKKNLLVGNILSEECH